ncbi:RadC family protein [uncultured Ruthenibacterium sp.]|uniref:JAB domain-containing protein n=1 Tax=uncultured Ruthenibacterium sp. TaxID=1905347 RepID=UPI00349EA73C
MGEHDHHRQRVFNRVLTDGLENFEEHNALELLLFFAYRRGDTNELAHRLIREFGSFSRVLDASVEDLQRVPGVGPTCAAVIKSIPQLCAYYLNNKTNDRLPLDSVEVAADFFRPKFFAKTAEEFRIAIVDDRRMLLRSCFLSEGTATAAAVNIPRIVSEALKCGGTGIFLAHNHPRGMALPSNQDIIVTQEVQKALHIVQLQLIDHLIFTDDDYYSFNASGILTANYRH